MKLLAFIAALRAAFGPAPLDPFTRQVLDDVTVYAGTTSYDCARRLRADWMLVHEALCELMDSDLIVAVTAAPSREIHRFRAPSGSTGAGFSITEPPTIRYYPT